MSSKADITCLCMTHGRPYLLEESMESFRRQVSIPSVSVEMLVVNDCPEQTLSTDCPNVRIINLPTPYTDISRKQNDAVEHECGRYVAYWDDDDIWMPWRLEWSWHALSDHPEIQAVKQARAWYVLNNVIQSLPYNLFFGSAMFSRDYYLQCGGAHLGFPADKTAWENMEAGGKTLVIDSPEYQTHFLYRWGGPGVHDSSPVGVLQSRATNEDRHRIFRQRTLASPLFRRGNIHVDPHYHLDYENLVRDAIKSGRGRIE